jgi:hypothetical protein
MKDSRGQGNYFETLELSNLAGKLSEKCIKISIGKSLLVSPFGKGGKGGFYKRQCFATIKI